MSDGMLPTEAKPSMSKCAESAIVWLARILGPHPSDPGSSPGGGMFDLLSKAARQFYTYLIHILIAQE